MLESQEIRPGEYRAVLNARGLYNSLHFVLRLSPDVHRRIAQHEGSRVLNAAELADFEDVLAHSTVLHETIHWWQHIGSTTGLMLSLSYPAQAHSLYPHLKTVLEKVGPKKSLRLLLESDASEALPPDAIASCNVVVNTCYDIAYFQTLITNPQAVQNIINDPVFSCEGNSYHQAYVNILAMLIDRVDKNFETLPDPRSWEEEFRQLRDNRVEKFYHGSPAVLANIGALELFEGQARFCQLHYASRVSGGAFSWKEANDRGWLDGKYVTAFELFLKLTGYCWPLAVDDPIVALFLLTCDLAMNPSSGFPLPISSFEGFVDEVHPGTRFILLCLLILKDADQYRDAIRDYSKEEYISVSEALAGGLGWEPPHKIAELVSRWPSMNAAIATLMEYYRTFEFPPENLPPALLLSHYIAFNQDRARRPEFFCWPGIWLTSPHASPEEVDLYNRHAALFIDKEDDDGIFPRILPGRDQEKVHKTYTIFYQAVNMYDMTLQWITKPGAFRYDAHRWLATDATPQAAKDFACGNFEKSFGIHPDEFEIVPQP